MKHATPILVALLLAAAVQAQQADFVHLTPRDGLSDGFVFPILQSQDGYMWFGTTAGLDRFDGYAVERFMHDPGDETSIRQGPVRSLLQGPDGGIWVGTETGLSRLDPHSLRFVDIELRADVPADSQWVMQTWALHRSADGTIWAGTGNGLYAFPENEPDQVRRYRHDPDDPTSIAASPVRVITGGVGDRLWLGTVSDGLTRFDISTGTATHFRHDPEEAGSLSSNFVWDIRLDRNGRMWIGTVQGGLCRFEPQFETFSCHRHDPADPASLSNDNVQSIFEDEGGRLWLGTDGGGVSILDPATATFTTIRNDPANPASLGEDDVHRIYRDRFGTLWFAHHNRGISRMTPGSTRFETLRPVPGQAATASVNRISDLIENPDGSLWVATEYGLVWLDESSGSREHFLPFPDQAAQLGPAGNRNFLTTLHRDGRGRLWTGNSAGDLMVFDPDARTFRMPQVPQHDDWVDPLIGPDGQVWVMAFGTGLWRVDPNSELVAEYPIDPDADGSVRVEIGIPYFDVDGTLWLAGYAGMDFTRPLFQRYRPETDDFESIQVSLPRTNQYNFIFMWPDRPGEFWLDGSTGLVRANVITGDITNFSRGDYGIPAGLRAMERDERGRLWYGTWTGSFGVFDPVRGTTTGFYPQDGLEISRFTSASRQLQSGELIFGGYGGYVRFHPDEVFRSGVAPELLLTGVHAAGQEVDFRGRERGGLRLGHDLNSLAFSFVALHFADPSRNQYRYMLDGFEDAWNRVGTQRTALYSRLPPGRYTFRVQAAGSDGIWNEEGAEVSFSILAPWWRTWWAYAFYGLMLVGGVFGADRVQRRRVVQKERERAREQELRHAREIEKAYESLKAAQAQLVQQEKLASLGALTAGIAHEIKNPLNFVNNFGQLTGELIEELRESLAEHPAALAAVDGLLSDLKMNTSKIEQHGKRADSIVKSMLQHSRGGSGTREAVDLNALVEEYVSLAYHGKRAQQPGFNVDLSRDFAPDVGTVEVVSQDLGRVVLNLVGNAFDAVNEHAEASRDGAYTPSVRVSTLRTKAGVQIRVEDNGPGIPPEIREKIFDPFFTTKAAGQGTGLGLSMSHEIVTQGHGGQLRVESRPGGGTTFTVSLPDSRT